MLNFGLKSGRKTWWRFAALAALPLTGCVSPYAPPAAGPTASVQVTMNNREGTAYLDIKAGTGTFSGERRIMKTTPAQAPAMIHTEIPADRPAMFYVEESMLGSNEYCVSHFSFMPVADASYLIFFSDIPAPPPTTLLGKLGHFMDPHIGSKCAFAILRAFANGRLVQVPVMH